MQIHAVLFDLDGTLVDTAPDLVNCLNLLLAELDRPTVAYETVRAHVSGGVAEIIRTGLNNNPNDINKNLACDDELTLYKTRYLELYRQNLSKYSKLFGGMETVLEKLDDAGLPWGVVTNKPSYLTEPLMRAIGLAGRCCSIISADTTPHIKPHPAPLLEACKRCVINPGNCIYVGDDKRDMEAGNAAGMLTLAAAWGYLSPKDNIHQWPAAAIINNPIDLLQWLAAC